MPSSLLQTVNSLFQTCYNNWEQAVRTQLVVDNLWTDLWTTYLQTCNNLCVLVDVDMHLVRSKLRSCSKIRHVKCSEMYLIVILNPKKTKASAEERGSGLWSQTKGYYCAILRRAPEQIAHFLAARLGTKETFCQHGGDIVCISWSNFTSC
jgi:hypothetical protein